MSIYHIVHGTMKNVVYFECFTLSVVVFVPSSECKMDANVVRLGFLTFFLLADLSSARLKIFASRSFRKQYCRRQQSLWWSGQSHFSAYQITLRTRRVGNVHTVRCFEKKINNFPRTFLSSCDSNLFGVWSWVTLRCNFARLINCGVESFSLWRSLPIMHRESSLSVQNRRLLTFLVYFLLFFSSSWWITLLLVA